MQKPRIIRDRGFWLYAVQRHRALGGFVGFIGSSCNFFNTVLHCYGLQKYWGVWCFHIDPLTQFDNSAQAAFSRNFLFNHWLIGLSSLPCWWQ